MFLDVTYYNEADLLIYPDGFSIEGKYLDWFRSEEYEPINNYYPHWTSLGLTYIYLRCYEWDGLPWSYYKHGHLFGVSARCGKCKACLKAKSNKIIGKMMRKYEALGKPPLYLWTFGTSLRNTSYNRVILKRQWRLFTQRLATYKDRTFVCLGNHEEKKCSWHKGKIIVQVQAYNYSPIFRVFEAGREGRRLHVHAIFTDFFDHTFLLHHWRNITQERSNINYQARQSADPIKAFAYCTKYLVKSDMGYSQMGDFLKIKLPISEYKCPIC